MTEDQFYDLLADALQGMVRDGVRVKDISAQTGLSSSTLYKFMSKQTTFPRLHTAWAVLNYFGYQVTVTKKGKSSGLRTQHITHEPTSTRLL
jgi:DNA-binding phage protein